MSSGEWPGRASFLEWALSNPAIDPLVGILDGRIAATGMGIRNGGPAGPIGWVGMIFVDPSLRRRGLGEAITEAVCDRLQESGCATFALIASNLGRPVYARMGFRIDAWYQVWEAAPTSVEPGVPAGTTLRRAGAADLEPIAELDRRATGEGRAAVIERLLDRAWVLETETGSLLAYLAQAQADCAAIVAPNSRDAGVMLDLLRNLGQGRAVAVRAALVRALDGEVDPAASAFLAARGWTPTFEAPRMLRGPSIEWNPSLLWGILGFSFG